MFNKLITFCTERVYSREYVLLDFPIPRRSGRHGGTWATGNHPSHIRVPYLLEGSAKEKEIHEERGRMAERERENYEDPRESKKRGIVISRGRESRVRE